MVIVSPYTEPVYHTGNREQMIEGCIEEMFWASFVQALNLSSSIQDAILILILLSIGAHLNIDVRKSMSRASPLKL
jgi:hypothetical protein